jgi:two-component system, response regulator PdtaR
MLVLVVEDEALVRAFAADLLEEAGFEVAEASSADYAIIVLAKRDNIRVVFTDVEMPGQLNGFELARIIHAAYKGIGIVIGSGRARPKVGEMPPDAVFLPKPYMPSDLLGAIKRVAA